MGKTATLYDVARLAGVSTATVSRVVHGHDRVKADTRDRVQAVIEELGYVPDGAAQSLSRRRKEIIGLVSEARKAAQYDVENMSLLFYDEVLHGVEAKIRDHGWSLLISYITGEDPDGFERLQAMSAKVDGLLIGEGIVESKRLAQLAARVPVVVIAGAPDERSVDVITAGNRSGAFALVSHLVAEHGRRRFFHVDGPANAPDARERRSALEQVLRAEPRCRLIGTSQGSFSVESGQRAAEQLLAEHADALPDAVVCANDQMAIGALQMLTRAGVKVPEQVAVVGFDDIYPGSLQEPPLTTVHQPMRLMGEHAAVRLLERIARPGLRPKVEVLATELVLRASCGCSPDAEERRVIEPAGARRRATKGRAVGTTAATPASPRASRVAARAASAVASAPRQAAEAAPAPSDGAANMHEHGGRRTRGATTARTTTSRRRVAGAAS
ncbi:MAG: LacI family DNA-binding transcriptional regulator [Actinomycetota bacterium]|nr:LacI family DNA-binding transcriptional regulator [Actinomycetota bacterium]